ncbi:LamG-like jellyroll fold domain-containing protein [Halosimplex sp. TS25]|uniref:DUF7266 family protein n=1 Tax=Halosimplex rarum TaxID=3396619 RepID=UPI0039EAB32D
MRHHSTDDRGVSTQISHVFGIAITSLLIVVLLNGVTGYVQDERARVADSQLETIGNQLASQVERADELGQHGGTVSVETTVDSTVIGNSYRVSIAEGDPCDTGTFHTSSCLVLDGDSVDATAKVPLNLTSDVAIEDEGDGTFVMTVVAGGAATDTVRPVADHQPRIGVGRTFTVDRFGTVVSPVNRPPIASFTFSPGMPRSGEPVRFSADDSLDVDGNIVAYKWDFGADGSFDALGRNVSRQLDPGPQEVTLRVVDNEGATSNVTRELRVSGLAYNGDLENTENGAEDEGAISFTVTNEYATSISPSVEIIEVMIDPKDDSLTSLDNDCSWSDCPFGNGNSGELLIDDGNDGSVDSQTAVTDTMPSGGRIIDIPDSETVSLFEGDSARFWVGRFDGRDDLSGTEFDIGVRYRVGGQVNSTVFTDVAGSPNVEDVQIEHDPDDGSVNLVVYADEQLDTIEADVGGDLTGVAQNIDHTTPVGDRYRHELNSIGTLSSGTIKANLTVAKVGGVSAYETRGSKSINKTMTILDGDYVWREASDWDAATVSDGVVHASFGDRQDDRVALGYPAEDQFGSGLAGYWTLDGTADDASGNGNHASEENGPGTGLGVFGTRSYSFDGTDDHLRIDDDPSLEMSDTDAVTVSMWVNKDTTQSGWTALFQHSDQSYNLQLENGNEPRFTIYDGAWNGATAGAGLGTNKWYHITGVFDGSTVTTYVDGQPVATTTASEIDSANTDLGIAENLDETGRHFDGKIDEVRVYDRALTDTQVESLSEHGGTLETGWKSGTQPLGPSNGSLQYDAHIPSATSMNVTVLADYDGDGTVDERSDRIELSDGQNAASVSGLSGTARDFKLEVELDSSSVVKTPVLHKIGLTEDA